METLRNTLFANKFEADLREVGVFFSIPFVGNFGLTGFDPLFWMQLSALFLLESIVNVAIAIIIYKFIVRDRGSVASFLVGYGFICPLLIYEPFWIIDELDLHNKALMISAATAPFLLFFRCFEAMYGTVPSFAEASMGKFIWYYAAPVQFDYDTKTHEALPVTAQEIRSKALKVVVLYVQCTVLFNLLIPVGYNLFPRREIHSVADLFFWGNLANNYVMGSLSSCCFESGCTAIALVTSPLSGMSTIDLNFKPLTASTSPQDFWGSRWNRLVSLGLKRGVYKPFRMFGCSRAVAALATFVASGLIHEYILIVMAMRASTDIPFFGTHLIFFLWSGIVLILQPLLSDNVAIRWMDKNLPAPVRTMLVFMTVLPIVHLFTQEYIDLGFYSDYSIGFPRIVWLGEQ